MSTRYIAVHISRPLHDQEADETTAWTDLAACMPSNWAVWPARKNGLTMTVPFRSNKERGRALLSLAHFLDMMGDGFEIRLQNGARRGEIVNGVTMFQDSAYRLRGVAMFWDGNELGVDYPGLGCDGDVDLMERLESWVIFGECAPRLATR